MAMPPRTRIPKEEEEEAICLLLLLHCDIPLTNGRETTTVTEMVMQRQTGTVDSQCERRAFHQV